MLLLTGMGRAKESPLLPASSLVAALGLYHMTVKFLTRRTSGDFGWVGTKFPQAAGRL